MEVAKSYAPWDKQNFLRNFSLNPVDANTNNNNHNKKNLLYEYIYIYINYNLMYDL